MNFYERAKAYYKTESTSRRLKAVPNLTTRWHCRRRALGIRRAAPLLPCASETGLGQAWGVGRASHMTRWVSWLWPSLPPACVRPSRAGGPAEEPLVGSGPIAARGKQ